ncbi:KR domain-containing protein, partial [Streptomyces rameus]|uniref:KR domain-containing protein n=1 Tax=Streptomyces rameus TaxID=68261 RepID=UPI0031EF4D85
ERISAEVPLSAVVHAAGVLDDGVLDGLSVERFEGVLRAKAEGARHLHELTRGLDLSAFVLFSSFSATVGGAGQGNYAAANAYLDALAEVRRAEGLPATSIAWGPWAENGMAADSALVSGRMERFGLPPMDPALAVTALERAISGSDTCPVITDVDWSRFGKELSGSRNSALFGEIAEVQELYRTVDHASTDGPAEPTSALAETLAALPVAEREPMLLDVIRKHTATVLGYGTPTGIDTERGFFEMGLDSLTAVELRNRLNTASGLRLPSTTLFDYASPAALARHLLAELAPDASAPENALPEEIDRLESVLSALPEDDMARARAVVRLQSMLAKLSHAGAGTAVQGATGGDALDGDLDGVSVDELFDVIDRELGDA